MDRQKKSENATQIQQLVMKFYIVKIMILNKEIATFHCMIKTEM